MAYRRRTLLPIGIHLNPDAVHMIQLEQAEDKLVVVSKAVQYFSAPAAALHPAVGGPMPGEQPTGNHNEQDYAQAREFVRQRIARNGFRGKEAVISLPAENLVIQYVRLPPMQPEELIAGLPGELRSKLPFDPRQAVIRHIVAGQVSENNEAKQDVIALAARRDVVERHVAAMTKIGLNVIGVGVEPCAMCYPYAYEATVGAPTQEGPPSLMIVYLGFHTTHVAIVRGQDTTFVKGVELGSDQFADAVAKAKGIPLEEAAAVRAKWREASASGVVQEAVEAYNASRKHLEPLVDEIESCMRYYASLARGAHIDRLIFLGPEARDRALVHVIGAHLGVPSEVGDPLARMEDATSRGGPEPEMAVAVGLSLFGAP